MILTYLRSWNKVKVIQTWCELLDPEQTITQSWKDLHLILSDKKPMLSTLNIRKSGK